jgi:hypothetical protein
MIETEVIAQLRAQLAAIEETRKTQRVALEAEVVANKRARIESDRVAEAARQVAETERKARIESQRSAEAACQVAKEWASLVNGTFYAALYQVFAILSMKYTRAHFDALFRTGYPRQGVKYTETLDAASIAGNESAHEKQSSNLSFETTEEISRWDIFGNLNDFAQIAHLIPAASDNAGMYDDVVAWALGLTENNVLGPRSSNLGLTKSETSQLLAAAKQKAIHGSMDSAGIKVASTGLKHSQSNKIRIRNPTVYMDDNPCLVIVPVMNLEEMKAWNGGGYEAIVMAETWADEGGKTITMKNVCSDVQMQTKVPGASVAEIRLAQELLQAVICGMAFSLTAKEHFKLPEGSATELDKLKNAFVFSNVAGEVTVPTLTKGARGEDGDDFPTVRKVSFGPVGDTTRHPAPDPLLLAVKAAVVWSTRHKQQLLAGEEVEDDTDSLSLQAMEEYLAWSDQLHRPKSQKDVAAGLGQADGCPATTAHA